MRQHRSVQAFSLNGGPLYRLGRRLGLARGTDTLALGAAIAALLWLVLAALALWQGSAWRLLSPALLGVHVRLLAVIPLLFFCESLMEPRLREFVHDSQRAPGIVPLSVRPVFRRELERIARWRDAPWPEAICLALAVLLSLLGPRWRLVGVTATYDPHLAAGEVALAGWWYGVVCLTVFRFLMLRWLWRLILWWRLLWHMSRLRLHLVPTHPDGVAGLGHLEVVHITFVPMVISLSLVQAAALAEALFSGEVAFEAVYPAFVVIAVIDALLFLAPLFLFSPRLWLCRVRGLADYMYLARRYVDGFERKWRTPLAAGEPLLGSRDVRSLAAMASSVDIVRRMRTVPLSRRLLIDYALAAAAPMLPLVLFKYPLSALATKTFRALLGL